MKTRVMLVEDNQMNSRLVEFVLDRDGFTTIVMADAEEAIRAAADDPPDIMLMDIQLPGMDGLEATRQLKKNPITAKIPIVAITAHAMTGDEERIRAAGCEGYISKPINTRELAQTIRKYLSA
ncbi:MAG: response regulator [Actinobacteria bacterium]|nr:response regulator [Actinomycetota bacterium]